MNAKLKENPYLETHIRLIVSKTNLFNLRKNIDKVSKDGKGVDNERIKKTLTSNYSGNFENLQK